MDPTPTAQFLRDRYRCPGGHNEATDDDDARGGMMPSGKQGGD